MNQDLESTLFHDQNIIESEIDQQTKTEKNAVKSFGLLPAKSGSRIQKIKNALIDTNDENISPIEPLR